MKLEFQSVVKDYHLERALNRVSFSSEGGDVVGIVGPNGAGKTTLIKLCARLLKPNDGKIFLDGKVGLLAIDSFLYSDLTVAENLELYAKLGRISNDNRKKYIEYFNLGKMQDKIFRELSFGQKKRVSLARVMLSEPQILLLDEPFLGLDFEAIEELVNLISKLKEEGRLVLISTHHLDVATNIINKLLVLKQGRLLHFGEFDKKVKSLPQLYQEILERGVGCKF